MNTCHKGIMTTYIRSQGGRWMRHGCKAPGGSAVVSVLVAAGRKVFGSVSLVWRIAHTNWMWQDGARHLAPLSVGTAHYLGFRQ